MATKGQFFSFSFFPGPCPLVNQKRTEATHSALSLHVLFLLLLLLTSAPLNLRYLLKLSRKK